MVKVITIRDDVYEKLAKLKRKRRESFSETILYLLSLEETRKAAKYELLNLAGILRPRDLGGKIW